MKSSVGDALLVLILIKRGGAGYECEGKGEQAWRGAGEFPVLRKRSGFLRAGINQSTQDS